jgi:osmotically-inducible protein OsmY
MSKRSFASLLLILASFVSCSKTQQDRARERAHEAERKLDEAGRKVKHEANRLAARAKGDEPTAKKTGTEADRLALVARAKAVLANQVGLKTLSSVSIECNGSTVTLSGRVPRAEDKARAQEAVSGLSGVTRVVNHIEVE